MKKLFLFLLPLFTYAQITKVPNDSLGEHIGLHIIYFLGRVNGGVSLGKLPDVNGREYHQLIWTNKDYDEEEECEPKGLLMSSSMSKMGGLMSSSMP